MVDGSMAACVAAFAASSVQVSGGCEGFRANTLVIDNSDVKVRVDDVAVEGT